MKIMYFRGKYPNFGDELNLWMWQKLLPDFFDDDENELFIGIGSTIGNHYKKSAKKIIFGTGFVPTYNEKPDVHTPDWDIYFVRGPRTAKELNISPELVLGDAAILLRTIVDFKNRKPEVVSFIPHWENLERGNWQKVCKIAGINLIDPRRPVEEVINELLRSKLVICEAMHGAIIADAFRIPWIPTLPIEHIHREKWYDWTEALSINLKPHRLLPSSVREAEITLKNHPLIVRILRFMTAKFTTLTDAVIIYSSACRLKKLTRYTPLLSDDGIIEDITRKMLAKLELLRQNYSK